MEAGEMETRLLRGVIRERNQEVHVVGRVSSVVVTEAEDRPSCQRPGSAYQVTRTWSTRGTGPIERDVLDRCGTCVLQHHLLNRLQVAAGADGQRRLDDFHDCAGLGLAGATGLANRGSGDLEDVLCGRRDVGCHRERLALPRPQRQGGEDRTEDVVRARGSDRSAEVGNLVAVDDLGPRPLAVKTNEGKRSELVADFEHLRARGVDLDRHRAARIAQRNRGIRRELRSRERELVADVDGRLAFRGQYTSIAVHVPRPQHFHS